MKKVVLWIICIVVFLSIAYLVYLRASLMAIAVAADNKKVVQAFLALGVSPNSAMDGVPALAFAVNWTCKYEMASLLLSSGADPGKKVPETTKRYATTLPLLTAAATGDIRCVKLLLEHGADVLAKDISGLGVAYQASSSGNVELMQLLASVGAPLDEPGKQGNTPLSRAAVSGDEMMISFLLSRGADECRRGFKGRTAKDKALASKNRESSKLFGKNCSVD